MNDCKAAFPRAGMHPFRIIAFDWDGTAVKDRTVNARPVARVLERLLQQGVLVVVITGTNVDNIDRQFCSLIEGAHKRNLFVCANRGSEVFGFDAGSRPVLLYRREATEAENMLLDRVAEAVRDEIEGRSSVTIDIVYQRLNRRKIDLIPEWQDPPKSQIGRLMRATNKRLVDGGFAGGIKGAFELAERYVRDLGLANSRITSDVKHIEVGLTDKSDSIAWMVDGLARERNIPLDDLLVLGDEFGPVAGFEGSDFRMVVPGKPDITYVSVGKEPNGVPKEVIKAGGGPPCFTRLMREQVLVHERFSPCEGGTFCLVEEGYDRWRQREIESLLAMGNGYLGTRASLEEQGRTCWPATFVAGVYDKSGSQAIEELVMFPEWLFTWVYVDGERLVLERDDFVEHRRVMDMGKGVYFRQWRHLGPDNRVTSVSFLHFTSLDDPHALVSRVSIVPENYDGQIAVKTGLKWYPDREPALELLRKSPSRDGGSALFKAATRYTDIQAVVTFLSRPRQGFIQPDHHARAEETALYDAWSWRAEAGQEMIIDKLVCVYTSRDTDDPERQAGDHLAEMQRRGVDGLLQDHLRAWEERWKAASITIKGHPEAQKWINFAAYHLISSGNARDDRVSIGARALTGQVYKGHVFWDSETFILPFFIYTHPPTARAMLMYRYHTLDAARARARAMACEGALFAWESTMTGEDMTPTSAVGRNGNIIPILCGQLEQHISADVAHGVWSYWNATQDDDFLVSAGAEILMETARFWVSRADKEGDTYHIRYVEGPDEYHEVVNDNIYTNMMAAWNIRRAVEVAGYLRESHPEGLAKLRERISLDDGEMELWSEVGDKLYRDMVDGNLIEQFEGYFSLRDEDISRYEPRTASMEVILGREKTEESQVVKQADVIMLLYILGDEFDRETIRSNFEYYDVRTAHDSSLSPSIYGLMAARLGLMRKAIHYLRQAGQIDLSDNMGNAAGGVHAGALGGLWQMIVMGFAGIRVGMEGVTIDPRPLSTWRQLALSIFYRGNRLVFDIRRGKGIELAVEGEGTVKVGLYGREPRALAAGRTYASRWEGDAWGDFEG